MICLEKRIRKDRPKDRLQLIFFKKKNRKDFLNCLRMLKNLKILRKEREKQCKGEEKELFNWPRRDRHKWIVHGKIFRQRSNFKTKKLKRELPNKLRYWEQLLEKDKSQEQKMNLFLLTINNNQMYCHNKSNLLEKKKKCHNKNYNQRKIQRGDTRRRKNKRRKRIRNKRKTKKRSIRNTKSTEKMRNSKMNWIGYNNNWVLMEMKVNLVAKEKKLRKIIKRNKKMRICRNIYYDREQLFKN